MLSVEVDSGVAGTSAACSEAVVLSVSALSAFVSASEACDASSTLFGVSSVDSGSSF